MRNLRHWLVVATAITSLLFFTGCADDSDAGTDTNAAGGTAGSAENGDTSGMGGDDTGMGGDDTGMGGNDTGMGGDDTGMGGDTGGGESTAVATTCDEATGPLPETAATGDYSPATRISSVVIPADKAAADAAGCMTKGLMNGSGLNGLLGLAGIENLDEFFAADAEDPIHLIGHMAGWAAGQTSAEVENPVLKMYLGEETDGSMYIDPESLEGGEPIIQFDANIDGCLVTTEAAPFNFTLPLEGVAVDVSLAETQVIGQVGVAENGITMSNTTISGYMTEALITDLVTTLKEQCESETPPSLCAEGTVASIISQPVESLVALLVPLLGSYDSLVNADGGVSECEGAECNAVSVCLVIESDAQTVAGVAGETTTDENPADDSGTEDGAGGDDSADGSDADGTDAGGND